MAYFTTATAPERRNPTEKNRVWEILPLSSKTHPANRRQSAQPRRKILPTATKSASGIPYWPSRDPIGENGGANLYGFLGNDGIGKMDVLGQSISAVGLIGAVVIEMTENLKKCKGGCVNGVDQTQACVGCCNGTAFAAQSLLAAAGVAGLAECLARTLLNPWGYAACAAIVIHAQSAAANGILDAHNACTDRCISQAP